MADPKKPANKIVKTNNRLKLSRDQKSIKESIQDVKRKFNRLNNKLKTLDRFRYQFKTLAAGANEFPGQNLSNPAGTKAMRKMSTSEWLKRGYARDPTTQAFRGPLTTDTAVKFSRVGIGAIKSAKHLGVGLALNYLSDRYLVPHAERLGTKLGEALVPIGRDIDRRLERKKK
jgi:hypothetical protein